MSALSAGRRRLSRLISVTAAGLGSAALGLIPPILPPGPGGPPPPSPPPPAGRVNFILDVTTPFAHWLTDSTPAQQRWMRAHYSEMRGYPPYHDRTGALRWGPPTDYYEDLYAVLRTVPEDRAVKRRHPDWILRDASGRALYIPYDCANGACAAYAADPGDPGWRSFWIHKAKRVLAHGYAGLYIDNVNMEMRVGDGDGRFVAPIDPRTSRPMTLRNWRRYVADFTELIRARIPEARITHNAGQWWIGEEDPDNAREIASADRIELERGFSQDLEPGEGTFGFDRYLDHVDWLHRLGKHVVVQTYRRHLRGNLLDLAGYLLVSDGGDRIASYFHAEPGDWWGAWQLDLGNAKGERYQWRGLWRRDFDGGSVFVDPPGGPVVSWRLDPGSRAVGQGERRWLRLEPREGAVVLPG